MPYPFRLLRHTTVRRLLTFKNPPPTATPPGDGLPQDLRGCSFILFVSPHGNHGSRDFQIDHDGTDPKLIYDNTSLQNGQITVYISDVMLDSYAWSAGSYWLQMRDALGDARPRLFGEITISEPNG